MTLREYTRTLKERTSEKLPKAKFEYIRSGKLRIHNKAVGIPGFFSGQKYREIVEEEFVVVHAGEVIREEWRELPYQNDEPWEF